ncbi:hypothetical protein B9T24_13735 [Acinetobacter sp. ANC 4654]|uniref:hypothetical protein n=1 Tax=Acinetobacter sp. ANC 4654 TaxID=1977872 RepID=UPI000A33CCD4|nr:hypothetical protein [Acinetobacter sp. ANC 4654]OTG93534.1 hypothetical protein B9T24_13735 [Acinetobacter sp. ANC 4654]
MKTMILKTLASSLFYFACSHAFSACSISDTGAGTIRLQPSTGATSTIQISVKCDTDFQIVFESTNLIDSSGQSLLKNIQAFGYTKLKNTISVQLALSGAAGSEWRMLKTQNKDINNHYIITAQLGNVNLAQLAAGEYRDRISITMDY